MNSFSGYMDKVKAEKELKTKTEAFVRAALLNEGRREKATDSVSEFKRGKLAFNKFLTAVSAVAACLALALGGYAYYHTPVSYVCLDINPSVEFGVNAFDKVVNTQAYNEDGLRLLEDGNYSNWPVEDAVGALVQNAEKQGFIAADGSTVIAVTAESNKDKTAAELQSSGEAGVNSVLGADGISAIVYSDCIDLQLRKQAKEAGISPGKLRLILILQTLDHDITIEEYKNAKMTDIITKANELLVQSGNDWQNGNDAEVLEKICKAAERVRTAYANAERKQGKSGTKNQVQNQSSQTKQQTENQNSDTGKQAQDSDEKIQTKNKASGTGSSGESRENNDNSAKNESQNQSSKAEQQTENQGSDAEKQAQKPDEQAQDQNQESSAAASSQNQREAVSTQSENGKSEQKNSDDSQTDYVSPETGTTASDSDSPSGTQSGNKKGGKRSSN